MTETSKSCLLGPWNRSHLQTLSEEG